MFYSSSLKCHIKMRYYLPDRKYLSLSQSYTIIWVDRKVKIMAYFTFVNEHVHKDIWLFGKRKETDNEGHI
jgi:hypothetical protein